MFQGLQFGFWIADFEVSDARNLPILLIANMVDLAVDGTCYLSCRVIGFRV